MTRPRQENDRMICAALFAAGTALLFYGSLVPFRFRSVPFADALHAFTSLFLVPTLRWGETADWSLNLTIMVPIAFFAMGALMDGRSRWGACWATPLVALACIAISLAVEFAQIWSVGRVASSRDVVAQTVGACVGILAWLTIGDRFSAWRRSFAQLREPQQRFEWVLQAYVIGVAIYSVVPVNVVMSPGELAQKYRSGLIEVVPFSYAQGGILRTLYSALTDILLFVPVGMCAAAAWNRRGEKLRPVAQSLLVGLAFCVGLELIQLFIVGRYTSSTDVMLGFAGVAAGVLLMHVWRNEGQIHRAAVSENQTAAFGLLGALAYTAFLAAIFWAPFRFTHDVELIKSRLDAFFEIPFVRMHQGSDLLGIFAGMRKVLWFVPLGVMCGMVVMKLPTRRHRWLSFVAATVAVLAAAVAIELGQVLIPDKIADSTDVMLTAFGGLVGIVTVKSVLDRGGAAAAEAELVSRREFAPSSQPLRGLDGLRALACLAVFGVHFQQATGVSGRWGPFDFGQALENGNTGVALFFVLSGFLLALPLWMHAPSIRVPETLHGYASKRLVRILPAYYLCLTALVVIKGHWQSRGELQNALLHYFCLQNYSPSAFYSISSQFWTIAVQMQFYLVFALILWGMMRLRLWSDRAMMTCFAAICAGSYLMHLAVMNLVTPEQQDHWGPVLTRSVLAHLPLFVVGVMTAFVFVRGRAAAQVSSPGGRTIRDVALTLSAIAVLLILSTPLDDWFQIPFGRYNLPYVPLLLAIMIFVTPDSGFGARLLEFAPIRLLGAISYGFFIYHLAVMGLVSRAMGLVGRSPQSDALLFAGSSIMLTVALASASYVLFERPLIDWLAGRRRAESSSTLRPAAAELH